MWIVNDKIPNSAGNLVLHLIGNLNHFFGAVLDKNDYLRDRDREFSAKSVSREELNKIIDVTKIVVRTAISKLSDADFASDYPLPFNDKIVKTDFFLVHLATHLTYHLGQINYHRRLLS